MLNIKIGTITHSSQRYNTVGDWILDEDSGDLTIYISDMGNYKKEFLVAFHELIEVMLCKSRGITQAVVDKFDIAYELTRPEGSILEPGDDQEAPYKKEHFFATSLERLMCAELGVDWHEYEKTIYNL